MWYSSQMIHHLFKPFKGIALKSQINRLPVIDQPVFVKMLNVQFKFSCRKLDSIRSDLLRRPNSCRTCRSSSKLHAWSTLQNEFRCMQVTKQKNHFLMSAQFTI